MNRREAILTTLEHKEPPIVPQQTTFFDINVLQKFIPRFERQGRKQTLDMLEYLDNFMVDVTPYHLHESGWLQDADWLCRVQLEHSCTGGGVLKTRVIEEDDTKLIYEWETGGRWRIYKKPFRREYISFPIQSEKDIRYLEMPDPNDPERYKGVESDIKFFKKKGYFTSAEIHGFFSGIWYRYYKMEDLMRDMIKNKSFIKELSEDIGNFNLDTARNFLERGVDSILFCDDLGDNKGLLMSPKMYEEFFYPWHKKLASLSHQYGSFCHMHSHGNITEILPLLVKAGIDILNPVEPEDGMKLSELKDHYGNHLTFYATTTRSIENMDEKELETLVKARVKVGREGGGFILRLGGITRNLNEEKFRFYRKISKRYRES